MRGKCGWCGAEAPADALAPRRGTAHTPATLSHLRGRDLSHLRGRDLSQGMRRQVAADTEQAKIKHKKH